jgi:hypothetical protein
MEYVPQESASIRQPHWHRHLDVKRPNRVVEELRPVAATTTERQAVFETWELSLMQRTPGQ